MTSTLFTPHFCWGLPPTDFQISGDEVHVWIADLEHESQLAQLAKTLSADEQERVTRFYFKSDRKRFVAARGILRTMLSAYTEIPAASLKFDYDANGKPRLANADHVGNLQFNLSHSGGLGLYAFSKNRRIGIDLELINFLSDMDEIANRCFSNEENSTLRFLDPHEKEKNFFRYWTRKEAQLKCSGEGFSASFQTESHFDGTLLELNPAEGYVGCLAIVGKPFQLQTWQWPKH